MQEKRRYERKPVDLAVEFTSGKGGKPVDFAVEFTSGKGERMAGVCRDLSLGGMHIQTQSPPPYASKVTVYVVFPGAKSPSVLPGVVRWTKPGEMGVQFDMLGARETHAITQALRGQ